jgi:glutamate synthase domain-containing protein 3
VVVLGKTGRNFAAGMSGGVAYVWDPDGDFNQRCNFNHGLTVLEPVTEAQDLETLRELIEAHQRLTRSDRAATLLQNWEQTVGQFVKVVSLEYRRVQSELEAARKVAAAVLRA